MVALKNFAGLETVSLPEHTAPEYLKTANNVDISKTGRITKRKGYSLVMPGDIHSLWSTADGKRLFAVVDGDLVRITNTFGIVTLYENIRYNPVSFEEVDGTVYFSTVSVNGKIVNDRVVDWGIAPPIINPLTFPSQGTLTESNYQVTLAYLSEDGSESGAKRALKVPAKNGFGIYLPHGQWRRRYV